VALFREGATQFVKFLYGFGHFIQIQTAKVASVDGEFPLPRFLRHRSGKADAYTPHTLQILGAREHHQISDRHILRPG
jgi:hypothetical protein